MNCTLGFQVVGQHITFYFTTLLCDALYITVEVGHVDVPMSLEVPAFQKLPRNESRNEYAIINYKYQFSNRNFIIFLLW